MFPWQRGVQGQPPGGVQGEKSYQPRGIYKTVSIRVKYLTISKRHWMGPEKTTEMIVRPFPHASRFVGDATLCKRGPERKCPWEPWNIKKTLSIRMKLFPKETGCLPNRPQNDNFAKPFADMGRSSNQSIWWFRGLMESGTYKVLYLVISLYWNQRCTRQGQGEELNLCQDLGAYSPSRSERKMKRRTKKKRNKYKRKTRGKEEEQKIPNLSTNFCFEC